MTTPHNWSGPEYDPNARRPEPSGPEVYRNYPERGAPGTGPAYGTPPYGTPPQPYGTPAPLFPIAQPPADPTATYPPAYPTAYPSAQPGYAVSLYGQAPYGQPVVAPKSPGLGLLASFFVPGLGTMINGEVGKGIGILIGFGLCVLTGILILPLFGALGLWVWGMVDAYTGAQRWNAQHGIIS